MGVLVNIPIPDVPKDLPADQAIFCARVKQLLEVYNGVRGPSILDLVQVTSDDVSGLNVDTPFSDTGSIKAPTSLTVEIGIFSHILTWVNCVDEHLAGVEIYAHTENSVTEASRIAICGRGTTSFARTAFNVTADWYYWIRSVSFSGKYSKWCPDPITVGGFLVPRADSLDERITGVMEALLGETPDLYDAATIYEIGEYVRWVDTDTNTKRYKRTAYDPGVFGKAPSLTSYWERAGILVQGDIDGQPTVGIDGNLVVDKTILARSIETAGLIVGDGSDGSIVMGNGVITVEHIHNDAKDELYNSNQSWEDITGVGLPENGATNDVLFRHNADQTKIDGGKIYTGTIVANAIGTNLIVAHSANIGTAVVTTAKIADAAITEAKIGTAAITEAKIKNAAITAAKIGTAAITEAKIGSAAVTTLKIGANAVTIPSSAFTAAALTVSGGGKWTTAQTVTFNGEGSPIHIIGSAYCIYMPDNYALAVRVQRSGVTIYEDEFNPSFVNSSLPTEGYAVHITFAFSYTPVSASYTYTFDIYAAGPTEISNRSLVCLGVKR